MKHYGRYIPNLLEKNLQQLHDIYFGLTEQMEMHFINGDTHPLSVRQQFFLHDLIAKKTKSGEPLTCNHESCGVCGTGKYNH